MIYKDCLIGHHLHDAKCLKNCIFLSKGYVYVAKKSKEKCWASQVIKGLKSKEIQLELYYRSLIMSQKVTPR